MKIKIKLIPNWDSSENAFKKLFQWMVKEGVTWNNLEVTFEDKADFYIILNCSNGKDSFEEERSLIFYWEPWCHEKWQTWGVKTWGYWANPDIDKHLYIRTHFDELCPAYWAIQARYNYLKTHNFVKTKSFSTLCTSNYFDPGHIKRIDFFKFLEKNHADINIDLYGLSNDFKFNKYVGKLPAETKHELGIAPYKYFLATDNNDEPNYASEKVYESIMCECLTFFWGTHSLDDYIDPRAFIRLNFDNEEGFEWSCQRIKQAIANNEWEERLPYIRREKQKVLDYYNLFPTVERLLNDRQLTASMDNDKVKYHKYFYPILNNKFDSVAFIKDVKQINYINADWYFILGGKKIHKDRLTVIHTNKKKEIVELFRRHNKDVKIIEAYNYALVDNHINRISNIKYLCINLERRPDRKKNALKEFSAQRINVEFLKAVDGKYLEVTNEIRKLFEGNDFGGKRGVVGCALTHYEIWQRLLKDNHYDFYVIFEDDVKLPFCFEYKLEKILSQAKDIDYIHLGYHTYNVPPGIREEGFDLKIEKLNLSEYVGGTFGYVIYKTGAQKLVDFIQKNGIRHGIDHLVLRYQKELKIQQYQVTSHLVFSEWVKSNDSNVDSDIQRDFNSI